MRAVWMSLSAAIALAAPIAAQLAPVIGKPWSGTETTELVQTPADGTHITQRVQKVMYYRDSEGRTRTDRVIGRGAPQPATLTEINDPVAGYHYNFNSTGTVAHRTKWPPQPPNPPTRSVAVTGVRPAAEPGLHPEISHESLGVQTIEGVTATGDRTTTVYPVGTQGNDRPLTVARERWMSQELGRAVLIKISDPRNGESTTKLTNISLGDPDPSLFQPPADYEIRDNNGPLTIRPLIN